METKYLLAMRLLLRGHKYLAVSFYRTVMANKALTAFIISLMLNISLCVSCTSEDRKRPGEPQNGSDRNIE